MDIKFERLQIIGLKCKLGATLAANIEVVAPLTVKVAEALEARWAIYDSKQVARAAFKKAELPNLIDNLNAQFFVPGLEQHELTFKTSASKFIVFVVGDGKKKGIHVKVKFLLSYQGDILVLIDRLMKIGRGAGVMTLSGAQIEMFAEPEKKGKEKKARSNGNGASHKEPEDLSTHERVKFIRDRGIPADPDAPEWRTEDEIAAGVPHYILP